MDNLKDVVEPFDADPASLEESLALMDETEIDEFNTSMDFDKFIVLNKKEVSNFCRIVEPLTKASIDDYGKSVFVTCIDTDTVELRYFNNPYVVCAKVSNKSNKIVKDFAVTVANLKKLVTNAFASIILVEEDNDINIALCESLLYLETKPLKASQYDFQREVPEDSIDKELATYSFKKIGAVLSCTDRASEKVAVIKGNHINFNTSVFTSKSKSPFGESSDFVLYKQVSDVIGNLAEITKVALKYKISDGKIIVDCDGRVYCEMPIGTEDKVNDFLSPTAELVLKFDANISVINDTFLRLVSIVKSLDYLSDIVTISFDKECMKLVITTTNQSKSSTYKFSIVEGAPDIIGDMKLTVNVLQIFLQIVGADVKYSFSENGLGIKNELGNFLIRKS